MKFKAILQGFLLVAPIAFGASIIVSYLYGLLIHGVGVIDWEGGFRMGIILGIVIPVVQYYGKKN
jgi:hypothetical protein